jgi:hypothetical protein
MASPRGKIKARVPTHATTQAEYESLKAIVAQKKKNEAESKVLQQKEPE